MYTRIPFWKQLKLTPTRIDELLNTDNTGSVKIPTRGVRYFQSKNYTESSKLTKTLMHRIQFLFCLFDNYITFASNKL